MDQKHPLSLSLKEWFGWHQRCVMGLTIMVPLPAWKFGPMQLNTMFKKNNSELKTRELKLNSWAMKQVSFIFFMQVWMYAEQQAQVAYNNPILLSRLPYTWVAPIQASALVNVHLLLSSATNGTVLWPKADVKTWSLLMESVLVGQTGSPLKKSAAKVLPPLAVKYARCPSFMCIENWYCLS